MKKDKKVFIIIEVILAVIVIALTIGMLQGRNKKDRERIAVIIENSDDNQWAAFKYGLEMAAEDLKVELFVVSKETNLTAEEERSVIESEIKNGADAVIVQPAAGADMEEMLKKIYKKVPLLLIEEIVDNEGNTTDITIVGPDDYAMGITLAEELLADSNENIKGKTLGLVSEKNDSAAAIKREKGFCDAMKDAGAKICWRVADSFSEEPENALYEMPKVDYVIALDDNSLTTAGRCAAANNLHGALVYGIGNSTEALYFLDIGYAECVVVPDEFNVGYQSVKEAVKRARTLRGAIKNQTVSHTVIRRETLFSEENQEILFTMSQ